MVDDETTLEELEELSAGVKRELEGLRQRCSKLPSGGRKSAIEATLARLIEHEAGARIEHEKLLRLLQD